jgi:chemotaxis response regulator CheB
VRKGIESILAVGDDLKMVGEAWDGREAVRKFQECHPDVAIRTFNWRSKLACVETF